MIASAARPATLVSVGVALMLVAACSTSSPGGGVVTVTVPPSGLAAPSAPAGATDAGGGSTPTDPSASSGSGVAGTQTQTTLPGTCDSLLPDFAIARAIGKTSLPGKDSFVVGTAEKDIGRLAYINCQYGVTGTGASAKRTLEVGVSLYSSVDKAAARIPATVDDYTNHGAQSQNLTVAGNPAMVLTGGVGDGYSDPLLVVAAGQRTVAVTVTAAIATGDAIATDASKVAALALTKTAP